MLDGKRKAYGVDVAVLTKADILDEMQKAWSEWEALLAEVGRDRMERPGVEGEWSVREIVAHLLPYTRRTAARLESVLTGVTPSPLDLIGTDDVPDMTGWAEDDFNAWSVRLTRDRSTKEIVEAFREAWFRLRAAIEMMPEDDLAKPGRFEWTGGDSVLAILPINSYEHRAMHVPTIRTWLDSTGR